MIGWSKVILKTGLAPYNPPTAAPRRFLGLLTVDACPDPKGVRTARSLPLPVQLGTKGRQEKHDVHASGFTLFGFKKNCPRLLFLSAQITLNRPIS
jgi:hypothetical protein